MSTSVSNIAARDEQVLEAAKRAYFAFNELAGVEKAAREFLWDTIPSPVDRARWICAAAAVLDARD